MACITNTDRRRGKPSRRRMPLALAHRQTAVRHELRQLHLVLHRSSCDTGHDRAAPRSHAQGARRHELLLEGARPPSILALDATGRPAGDRSALPGPHLRPPRLRGTGGRRGCHEGDRPMSRLPAARPVDRSSISSSMTSLVLAAARTTHSHSTTTRTWWRRSTAEPSRYADGCWRDTAHWTPSTPPTERRGGERPTSSHHARRCTIGAAAGPVRRTGWISSSPRSIDHVAVLHERPRGTPASTVPSRSCFPYLQPLLAAKFGAFARERVLDMELTNECYVSLFSSTRAPNEKVAHIIACHETYHMWREPDARARLHDGAPGLEQLVSSLRAVMEHALRRHACAWHPRLQHVHAGRVARTRPGYETGTRAADTTWMRPIGADGQLAVARGDPRTADSRITRAFEPDAARRPSRCATCGSAATCRTRALPSSAAAGTFSDIGAAMSGMFSNGDFGLSDAIEPVGRC